MNLYFVVEGKTERKVYPQWLNYLLPGFIRVDYAQDAIENNYYLISGGGYPSILDNHLRNAVDEINEYGNYDMLILVIDTDEMSVFEKIEEINQFITCQRILLKTAVIKIVAQNCCMETWFLGNKKVYSRHSQTEDGAIFASFYDVSKNDPEFMPKPNAYIASKSIFHYEYLRHMLLEKNIKYSKRIPREVGLPYYINELQNRTHATPQQLESLNNFFQLCKDISVTTFSSD